MAALLNHFLTAGILAFLLSFVRMGSAIMIMPGLGDSFTPRNIRLYIALGLSVTLAPFIATKLPTQEPSTVALFGLIASEFVIGSFIGIITRLFLSALDTGGMLISMASGLGSAQLFNPGLATQGSLVGSFLTITGVVLVFVTNTYQFMFGAIIGSYKLFPIGVMPDPGAMTSMLAHGLTGSFQIALEIAAPFLIISLLMSIGMGVMARVMPQIQIFMIALPLQILLFFIAFSLVFSTIMLFWLNEFQNGLTYFMSSGG